MMNVFVFSGYVRAKASRNSRIIEKSPLVTFDYPSSITGGTCISCCTSYFSNGELYYRIGENRKE